jgi:predicted Zn-dependent protease
VRLRRRVDDAQGVRARLDSVGRGVAELATMLATPGAGSTPSLLVSVAQELEVHGHPAEARATLRRAVAAAHAMPPATQRSPDARFDLAQALYLLGDLDAAAPMFAALESAQPDNPRFIAYRGILAARRGQRVEAERVDGELRTLRRDHDRGQTALARARLAAARGDAHAALSLLRQALAEGVPYGVALHADAELAALRADPDFLALLAPRG